MLSNECTSEALNGKKVYSRMKVSVPEVSAQVIWGERERENNVLRSPMVCLSSTAKGFMFCAAGVGQSLDLAERQHHFQLHNGLELSPKSVCPLAYKRSMLVFYIPFIYLKFKTNKHK